MATLTPENFALFSTFLNNGPVLASDLATAFTELAEYLRIVIPEERLNSSMQTLTGEEPKLMPIEAADNIVEPKVFIVMTRLLEHTPDWSALVKGVIKDVTETTTITTAPVSPISPRPPVSPSAFAEAIATNVATPSPAPTDDDAESSSSDQPKLSALVTVLKCLLKFRQAAYYTFAIHIDQDRRNATKTADALALARVQAPIEPITIDVSQQFWKGDRGTLPVSGALTFSEISRMLFDALYDLQKAGIVTPPQVAAVMVLSSIASWTEAFAYATHRGMMDSFSSESAPQSPTVVSFQKIHDNPNLYKDTGLEAAYAAWEIHVDARDKALEQDPTLELSELGQ